VKSNAAEQGMSDKNHGDIRIGVSGWT